MFCSLVILCLKSLGNGAIARSFLVFDMVSALGV